MTNYVLPEDLRDELLRYLSMRPYREVASAVAAISQLVPIPEPKTPSAQ